MLMHRISYAFILLITWPMRYLPFSAIHLLGEILGLGIYYCVPKFRKRSLSNLALASKLNLTKTELQRVAKQSLQNLMITCLEYSKFAQIKKTDEVVRCENPEVAAKLIEEGKSVIFFCGHQANWEVLFLEGIQRMPGIAIGRPIKNGFLYNWILSIRQKFGGKIITPQNAIREGLRNLKKGAFMGIVGDQGMPDSGYSCPFLGRRAWTSPIAAILSHRTGCPIFVATTRRVGGKYIIHYSDPIWPQTDAPAEQEIDRLMKLSLAELEKGILAYPGQWLWSHNRWKQQTPEKLKKRFRHESILVILPEDKGLASEMKVLREVYPTEFLTILAPEGLTIAITDAEVIHYCSQSELLREDYRFKLVYDFTCSPKVKAHYQKFAAFDIATLDEIRPDKDAPFDAQFKSAVMRSYAP